jgi:hypothetical protein
MEMTGATAKGQKGSGHKELKGHKKTQNLRACPFVSFVLFVANLRLSCMAE